MGSLGVELIAAASGLGFVIMQADDWVQAHLHVSGVVLIEVGEDTAADEKGHPRRSQDRLGGLAVSCQV